MKLFRTLLAIVAAIVLTGAANAQESMTSIVDEWANSAHADATAEAFVHWNDEGEIPPRCALCHAGAGLRAFYGLDQSAVGEISEPIATGGVVDCDTCHIKGAAEISEVKFPSGIVLAPPANNGTCFTCHQGRQSGSGVAAAIAGMDRDAVNPELSFLNPHYAAAAATLMGSVAGGPFEFEGKVYRGQYAHVPQSSSCTDCHSPHSLEVRVETCAECHKTDMVENIRISLQDFDGDGDTAEGISGEIATLHSQLGDAIAVYSKETAKAPVVYAAGAYPYYFNDTNGDGSADEDEAVFPNRYASWTPRLLTAAYNYQFVAKDPGSFAHNPHYTLQILYDSIEDLTGEQVVGYERPE